MKIVIFFFGIVTKEDNFVIIQHSFHLATMLRVQGAC